MADGAPILLNGPAPTTDLQLATSDASDLRSSSIYGNDYGIFLHGTSTRALNPDSIISLDYSNDFKLAQYPQQDGAFQTYNKVNTPFEIHIRLTKMGTASDRGTFLAQVENAAQSLDVYDVVTPEKTYLNANITKVAHVHNAQSGAAKMTIDLILLEIRNTVTTQFADSGVKNTPTPPITKAATKTGNDPVNTGIVQALPMPPGPAITVTNAMNAISDSFLGRLVRLVN